MLFEFSIEMRYIICTLVVWRLTHLFVEEDGPWDFVFRLRKFLGNTTMGKAMDCFYCFSLWIAAPVSFIISTNWATLLLSWLSLSAGACLLQQLSGIRK